jgi:hypothetical protein
MLPAKHHPHWKKLAENPESFKDKASGLPTKMLLSRLKIKGSNSSVDELIAIAHEFFTKNEKIVAADIKMIFG